MRRYIALLAFVLGGVLYSSPVFADISVSPVSPSTDASVSSSGLTLTLCGDSSSGSLFFYPMTSLGAFDGGQIEQRSGDGCSNYNLAISTTDNHGNSYTAMGGSYVYAEINFFNGSSNLSDVYLCASGLELTLDSSLSTGCTLTGGGGSVPPFISSFIIDTISYTVASSTCEQTNIDHNATSTYYCTATSTIPWQLFGGIAFGLAVIITMLGLIVVGFVWNSIKPRQKWR